MQSLNYKYSQGQMYAVNYYRRKGGRNTNVSFILTVTSIITLNKCQQSSDAESLLDISNQVWYDNFLCWISLFITSGQTSDILMTFLTDRFFSVCLCIWCNCLFWFEFNISLYHALFVYSYCEFILYIGKHWGTIVGSSAACYLQ